MEQPRASAMLSVESTARPLPDPLSDVLRTVRLNAVVFFVVNNSSPWGNELPDGATLAPILVPRSQRVISYHVVTSGKAWGGLPGGPGVPLERGDVLVFPRGDAYALSSEADLSTTLGPREMKEIFERLAPGGSPFVVHNGGGGPERAVLVCGFLGCDMHPFNPLLATLPRVLVVRRAESAAADRLDHLVELTLAEAHEGGPGGESVRLRLGELLFLEVLRRYLANPPPGQSGWLAGLRDPVVGRALALLHETPARPWTLSDLARSACSSRSVLADRFARLVGYPPMRYLTSWRMQVAARLLADGEAKVSAVALEVGYDSEAAFSRAFKKAAGVAPAEWRKRCAAPPPLAP